MKRNLLRNEIIFEKDKAILSIYNFDFSLSLKHLDNKAPSPFVCFNLKDFKSFVQSLINETLICEIKAKSGTIKTRALKCQVTFKSKTVPSKMPNFQKDVIFHISIENPVSSEKVLFALSSNEKSLQRFIFRNGKEVQATWKEILQFFFPL